MDKLVLLSGGMDSTIALFDCLDRAKHSTAYVHAMGFNYGQRHVAELDAAERVMEYARSTKYSRNVGAFLRLNISDRIMPRVGALMKPEVPTDQYFKDGTNTADLGLDNSFIPHRNLFFITIAAMHCRSMGVGEIVTGLRGGFPDCTPEFESQVAKILQMSDPTHQLQVTSPVHCSRAECLRMLWNIKEGWEALKFTLTCFQGTRPPCGECLPCTKRAEGFHEFGQPDPIVTG